MSIETRVFAGPEWGRVENALEHEEHSTPARLHFELRQSAEEVAEEARQRVRQLPTRGRGHTGLRERVAAGVRVTGVSGFYRITTSMPSGQEIIPRGLDRRAGWTHPVFGNPWSVRQRPLRSGWFMDSFQDEQSDMSDELEDVLEDSADTIAAAGIGP
jgi:hypothetical protein